MRSKILSWLGLFLILAGSLLPAVRALAMEVDPARHGGGLWTMTSSGPVYAGGNTTWTYTFTKTGNPHELSHMDVVLCNAFNGNNVTASHGGTVGPDGALGLPHVIKWEAPDLRGTTTVTVTYQGLWATGTQSWYVKAGTDVYSGSLAGPTCESLAPDFEVTKLVSASSDPATGQPSLTLTGGGTAHYFFTVRNTGNTPLLITSAIDPKIPGISFPTNPIPVGGSATVSATKSFPELAPGSPPQTDVNTITVTAAYEGQAVGPKAASATVINQAPAARPSMRVVKKVNNTGDSASAADAIELNGGGTAYYFYTLYNEGNVPLAITGAIDDKLGAITFTPAIITPGGSATATATKLFPSLPPDSGSETEVNTIAVTASYDGGSIGPVTDTARVINRAPAGRPSFTVKKAVSATYDPTTNETAITLVGGGTAYYFFTITNTGDVPLVVASGTDDRLGPLAFSPSVVEPGGTATAQATEHFAALPPGSADETVVNLLTVTMSYQGTELGPQTATAQVTNRAAPPPRTGGFMVTKKVGPNADGTGAGDSLTLTGGGTAHFFFTATNTGDLPLTITQADDNVLGAIAFTPLTLQPGESATATHSKAFPALPPGATSEVETNTITVDVTYSDGTTGRESDSATVTNQAVAARPSFTVVKTVGAASHPASPDKHLILTGGGTAHFFYTITNTGNVPLTLTLANDDKLGSIAYPAEPIPAGGSVTLTASKSFAPLTPGSADQTEVNEISVKAEYGQVTLTRTDTAQVTNRAIAANFDFTVTKKVSALSDPATGTGSITLTGGGTAYFFYTVQNTGNVDLTISAADDDILGPLSFSPLVVPVGGSATATASKSFPALPSGAGDQVETNTVVVTAGYGTLPPVSKSAQATVTNRPATPPPPPPPPPPPSEPRVGMTVEKMASTSGDPATGQPLVTLTGGGTVFYFYTVRNTGESFLTIDSATDDQLGVLHFTPTLLAPGAVATAIAQKNFGALPPGATSQTEVNVVTVRGTSAGQSVGPVTAQATVINQAPVARPEFTVTKRVSTDSDPATGRQGLTLPAEGGNVFYFFIVTNTGNVPITITEAIDDMLGPVSLSPATLNPGQQATGMLTKSFGPADAGQVETNVVTVKAAHGGVVYGPKTDTVSVAVDAQAVGALEVRVYDSSPRNAGNLIPISGAAVTLSDGRSGTTDHMGRVRFTNLPFGSYQATGAARDPLNPTPDSLKSGTGSATISAAEPEDVINILLAWDPVLAPPVAPSIRIMVCPTFIGLGGVITAVGPDGSSRTAAPQPDGTLLLANLTDGQWTLTMSATTLHPPVSRTINLRADHAVPDNAYSMDLSGVCPTATGAASGRICSPAKPGAEIRGLGPDGATALATVASNGVLGEWREYRLASLLPGQWSLTLHTPGQSPITQSVMVVAGETTQVPDFSLACTGGSAPDLGTIWYFLAGGLMVVTGVLLRRKARMA